MHKPSGLKLRNGIWHADKIIRVCGKRFSIRKTTKCTEEQREKAEALLEEWIAEAKQAEASAILTEHTFLEAAAEYVLSIERKGKDPERAMQDINLLDDYIGDLPLSHVHQGALIAFEEAQKGVRRSATVARAYRTVTAVLNYSARVLRDGNRPWLSYAVPKITAPDWNDQRPPYRLTWEEQDALIEVLADHLKMPTLFALATGAREQEVAGMRWDWEIVAPGMPRGAVWRIPAETRKGNARKTASEQEGRYLICNTMARSTIDAQRDNSSAWVFPKPDGQRTGRLNNSGFRRARAAAGILCRWHDLRHTFGERAEAVGIPFEYRKVLLGHAVTDITVHYSPPGLVRLLEMAEKVTREKAITLRIVRRSVTHDTLSAKGGSCK